MEINKHNIIIRSNCYVDHCYLLCSYGCVLYTPQSPAFVTCMAHLACSGSLFHLGPVASRRSSFMSLSSVISTRSPCLSLQFRVMQWYIMDSLSTRQGGRGTHTEERSHSTALHAVVVQQTHTEVASNHPLCSRVTVVTCYIYVADTFGAQLTVLYTDVLLNHWCKMMHSSMWLVQQAVSHTASYLSCPLQYHIQFLH